MFSLESWIGFILTEVYSVVLLAFIFRRQMREEKQNVWLKTLLVMFALYMGYLFYNLLVPTYFYRRFSFSADRVNLIPFRALKEWLAHPFNFFGNVLLFMPLGFFEVLLYPADSRKRQLAKAAAAGASLSLFVEFAQCFNYRVPDVDDILLNTLGSVLGALLCMLQQKLGFQRTRVGRVLLPAIPRTWRRHMLLNRFCAILVVSMEIALFAVNYFMTIPKARVRTNEAPVTAAAVAAAEPTAAPESSAEPTASADAAAEPTASASEKTPEPTRTPTPSPSPSPTPAPKVYHTENLLLEARNILLVRLGDRPEDDWTIFAVGSGDPIYPASTIKMLTALTVLEIAQPEETVQLGMEVYIPPLDAARAGLEYGMTLTVHDLLEGLLLPSGADAAYVLAVYCGRQQAGDQSLSANDAVKVFVQAMNQNAEKFGASHTTVKNVVGLDDSGQLTTAEDILKIARVFLSNPVLAEICGLPRDLITSSEGRTVSLKNTNKMLLSESPHYNSAVYGVKTGTTSRAGNCLVSVFAVGEERYLCIVMNSSYDGKFEDTQKLFNVCAGAE